MATDAESADSPRARPAAVAMDKVD